MSEVKLLELPEPWQCETAMCPALYTPAQMHAYARAHLAEREREVEALRAEVESLKSDLSDYMQAANYQATRAERLAEALRGLAAYFQHYMCIPEDMQNDEDAEARRHLQDATAALPPAAAQEAGRE